MILMPAWVVSEDETGYFALLGSEPRTDAEKEFLPKECVENVVYAAMLHESGNKLALFTLINEKIPEKIAKILGVK